MRHQWERLHGDISRAFQVWRRCKNCGAKQKREAVYLGNLITGYGWEPKAGRCVAALDLSAAKEKE